MGGGKRSKEGEKRNHEGGGSHCKDEEMKRTIMRGERGEKERGQRRRGGGRERRKRKEGYKKNKMLTSNTNVVDRLYETSSTTGTRPTMDGMGIAVAM